MDIFCTIANKETQATILYETPHILAFLVMQPTTSGHTLVIPKRHTGIIGIDDGTFQEIFSYTKRRAAEIKNFYGYHEIILSANEGASVHIPHFHLHIYGKNNEM